MPHYFTSETDEYIKEFLEAESSDEKNKIFEEGIREPFEKLIEGLIYSYKFFNIGDVDTLKKQCLGDLYERIPKFDPAMGCKGFSYFNVVAKNWFFAKSKEQSKKKKTESELHVDIRKKSLARNPALAYAHHEEEILEKEFFLSFISELDAWRSKLTKKNERAVLEAVIYLLKNSDDVPIYNKKAIYLYIREMTNLNEKQVATTLKKMRDMYAKWKKGFLSEN